MAVSPFAISQNTRPTQPSIFDQMRAKEEEKARLKANRTQQEKAEQFALREIQQGEIKQLSRYLKSSGMPDAQIKQIIANEVAANAKELEGLRQSQNYQVGYQASQYGDPFKSTVRSGMTYAEAAPQFAQKVESGYNYLQNHRVMQRFADKVGMSLKDAMRLSQLPTDRPVTVADVQAAGGAKHPEAVAKLANLLNSYGAGQIDPSQLTNLKPVKDSPGVFTQKIKIRGGETVDAYFIRDEATGKYVNASNLYKHWNNKAGLGALGIVLAVGIGLLSGPIAGALEGTLGGVGSQIAAGAFTGGLNAAIQGGDIGKGILTGGIGGAAGGFAGDALKGVKIGGEALSPEVIRAGTAAARGLGSSLAAGQGIGGALRSGAISGGAQYAGDVVFGTGKPEGFGEQALQSLGRQAIGYGISSLVGPSGSRSGTTTTSAQDTGRAGGTTITGVSPSSQALGQALRTGDISGPLFGSEGKEGKRQNVWNVASLKFKDETGS